MKRQTERKTNKQTDKQTSVLICLFIDNKSNKSKYLSVRLKKKQVMKYACDLNIFELENDLNIFENVRKTQYFFKI